MCETVYARIRNFPPGEALSPQIAILDPTVAKAGTLVEPGPKVPSTEAGYSPTLPARPRACWAFTRCPVGRAAIVLPTRLFPGARVAVTRLACPMDDCSRSGRLNELLLA